MRLGVVVHAYNPSYSEGRDEEDCSSMQTVCLTSISTNKIMLAHACHLSYAESINRKPVVRASQSINAIPYLKIN
jgi:hypothetical protein